MQCDDAGPIYILIVEFVHQIPNQVNAEPAGHTLLQLCTDVNRIALTWVEKIRIAVGQRNDDTIPVDGKFDRDFGRVRVAVALAVSNHIREELFYHELEYECERFVRKVITREGLDKLEDAIEFTNIAAERGPDR